MTNLITSMERAKQLAQDLRHDAHTRHHFSISIWEGKNTCGTVGCIVGTSVAREFEFSENGLLRKNLFKKADRESVSLVELGQRSLGILNFKAAAHLFLPWNWVGDVVLDWYDFTYLSPNERPSLDTVKKMKDWALSVEKQHDDFFDDPNLCARALELVAVEQMPYCDWRLAHETA